MLFYIFETQVSNYYKFGTTTHDLSIKRLKQYRGLNKPSKVITVYTVDDGYQEERRFKSFLYDSNVEIVLGNEFFEYKSNINDLIHKFRSDCISNFLTFYTGDLNNEAPTVKMTDLFARLSVTLC